MQVAKAAIERGDAKTLTRLLTEAKGNPRCCGKLTFIRPPDSPIAPARARRGRSRRSGPGRTICRVAAAHRLSDSRRAARRERCRAASPANCSPTASSSGRVDRAGRRSPLDRLAGRRHGRQRPRQVVHVLPKPGVMDPVAQSALAAIADFGFTAEAVRTLRKYWLGQLPADRFRAAVREGAGQRRDRASDRRAA